MAVDFAFAYNEDLSDLGGAASRFDQNIEALRILKELADENRTEATAHEQTRLARYTGWGDSEVVRRAFPGGSSAHIPPAEELRDLVTDEELRQMRASALNAHYTSIPVIRAIYDALLHAGIATLSPDRRLRVLEPSAGVGHFFGAMPRTLQQASERVAVELDAVTARILRLLYPEARTFTGGFEATELPANFFDLVISNVPFGNYKVADVSFREHYLRASIHDYFFAKALRVTRPGGCVAFITSRFTLDKQDARVRAHLAAHAELLACARLPNNAFARNAGTQVVTDLLILRKRAERLDREAANAEDWVHTDEVTVPDERGTPMAVRLNRRFAQDSSLMLGDALVGPHGLYGRNEFTVRPVEGDLGQMLSASLCQQLAKDGLTDGVAIRPVVLTVVTPAAPSGDEGLELALQQELTGFSEARAVIEQRRAESLVEIYRAAKAVIEAQVAGCTDEELKVAQGALGELYDRFRVRYGYINSKANLLAFDAHNSLLAFLRALEEPNGYGGWRKAALFTERTIRSMRHRGQSASAMTAKEALLLCLNEQGRVDLAWIATCAGREIDAVKEELRGTVFKTPAGTWVTRDEYLSGDVRSKLRDARAAAALDERFRENVEALEAAQPEPLGSGDIIARLGAAWIPEEIVRLFAKTLVPRYTGSVRYLTATAQWVVEPPAWDTAAPVEATQTWGTRRAHFFELLEDALNMRRSIVYDQVDENTRRINQGETVAAQAKQQDVKEKFAEWVWQDAGRERELVRLYNEQFNRTRPRTFDGSHLTLPGASTKIELRPWQKDAAWRILQSTATLVVHSVGAGKTMTAIAAAMELRRLGIARKSMITVPKHVLPGWVAEAQRLYPGVRLLATDARDFAKAERGRTMSRIATGDWDLVLVPHPSFKSLPVTPETANRFITEECEQLRADISELKDTDERGNRRSIKALERVLKRFEAKLRTADAEIKRDDRDTITFEQLGVEALFVDEFHCYKNLFFPTKAGRIAGLANSESQQAFDMFVKSQWLLGQGGRFVGLTGTPISNSLCEGYVMMRYFQLDLLRELGLTHFDAWAQSFGETVTGVEMKPDGSGFRINTRFAKFVNVAELARLQRLAWDVRTAEQMDLPRPRLAGGSAVTVAVPASEELKAYVQTLAERSERVAARAVDPSADNMLKITGDGRRAALDMRLVQPSVGEIPNSKIDHVVERIGRIWQRSHANRGAQIVFLDLATPKGRGAANTAPAGEEVTRTEELRRAA